MGPVVGTYQAVYGAEGRKFINVTSAAPRHADAGKDAPLWTLFPLELRTLAPHQAHGEEKENLR